MLLKRLLLKLENGQTLTEKQEKSLASKLYLITPFRRTLLYSFIAFCATLFLVIAINGGHAPLYDWLAYLLAAILLLLLLFLIFVPKHINIKRYFLAVEKFYEAKFKDYKDFDVLYVGQHINPHIRLLKTPKIYILTDGYHFLFVNDYFKDTNYPLPKYLTKGNQTYLRVLNDKAQDHHKLMVRLPDVEQFYLIEQAKKEPIITKSCDYLHYTNFLDQNPKMDETFVVLKMKGGIIFRLSYEAYLLFTKTMPLKELRS